MSTVMPGEPLATNTVPGKHAVFLSTNLRERIASGLVMALVALGLVYAGATPFALLVFAVAMPMCWEWGRVVRGASSDASFFVHALAIGIAIGLGASGYPVVALAVLAIGAIALLPMAVGRRAWLSALGVFYVGLPSLALLWIRSDPNYGFRAILFLFFVVWTTDVMAFVAGRAIGGAKLWPSISPNKTWSGLVGGVASSAILSMVYSAFVPGTSPVHLAAVGFALSLVAQAGDLTESALKRHFGVKDASDLIPGHGGVMDRMDGIVAVAVAAAVLATALNPRAPASALLLGG